MGDEDSGYHWSRIPVRPRFPRSVGLAQDPTRFEKLRLFIFIFARNLLLQPLLNQYITGTPKGQQETSPERNEAGPGAWISPGGR
jgi:hypothetical protein